MSTEPAKIYPYHLLLITNYRLPADVDRLNIEVRKGICDDRDFS
jgi:actin-binding LIM protein